MKIINRVRRPMVPSREDRKSRDLAHQSIWGDTHTVWGPAVAQMYGFFQTLAVTHFWQARRGLSQRPRHVTKGKTAPERFPQSWHTEESPQGGSSNKRLIFQLMATHEGSSRSLSLVSPTMLNKSISCSPKTFLQHEPSNV